MYGILYIKFSRVCTCRFIPEALLFNKAYIAIIKINEKKNFKDKKIQFTIKIIQKKPFWY
jgi:hypothetical protein